MVNFIDKHKVTVQSLFGLRTKLDPYKRLSVSIICSQRNLSFNIFQSSVVISISVHVFKQLQKLVSKPQLAIFRHKEIELMRNILKRNNYMLRAMEFANKRDHENPLGVFLIMQGRRHRG